MVSLANTNRAISCSKDHPQDMHLMQLDLNLASFLIDVARML